MSPQIPEASDFSVEYTRNVALAAPQRRVALVLLCLPPLAIGAGLSLVGAWPVLPFAGLEAAVLVWAFREIRRSAGDYERITIAGDTLTVETVTRSVRREERFSRHWAQVLVESPRNLAGPRVSVRSHGRQLELGRGLPAEERLKLAKQLIKSLGNR